MKAGIVTLDGNFNYGNRLQAYAVSRILEKNGVSPVFLIPEAGPEDMPLRKLKDRIRAVVRGVDSGISPEDTMSRRRMDAFKEFGAAMTRLDISKKTISELNDSFDIFFVGSDQVWNPEYIRGCEDWFFLKFADETKRNAIAASIGVGSLTQRQLNRMKKGVAGFSRISVREERGAELIKDCSGIDADVICDPTLVLQADEWRTVSVGKCTPDDPYVFTYLLGGTSAEAAEVLDKVTDHGRIPLIPLSDRQKPGEPDAGPAEFIDIIDHAVHVVTDSFHAAVFSSILQTPLTIVHRKGGVNMFSRLEQLSKMLDIEDKVFGSSTFDLARSSDYEGVSEAIERERSNFIAYLEGCLNA